MTLKLKKNALKALEILGEGYLSYFIEKQSTSEISKNLEKQINKLTFKKREQLAQVIFQKSISLLNSLFFLLILKDRFYSSFENQPENLEFFKIIEKREENCLESYDQTYLFDQFLESVHLLIKGKKSDSNNNFQFEFEKLYSQILLKVPDFYFAEALAYLTDFNHFSNKKQQIKKEINYRDLDLYNLSFIFEYILEFSSYILNSKQNDKKLANCQSYFLIHEKKASPRKSSGSFFTPTKIIQYMVEDTIQVIIQQRQKNSQNLSEEILKLKILDPALGSGDFLISAIEYLTKVYFESLIKEKKLVKKVVNEENFQALKRQIAENCLYGVDINVNAVELSKIKIWLSCYLPNQPLPFLENHIKVGNSLTSAFSKGSMKKAFSKSRKKKLKEENTFYWDVEFPEVFSDERTNSSTSGGFSAILSNPPYISLYSRESQKKWHSEAVLEKYFKEASSDLKINQPLSGRKNYFLLFLLRAISLLDKKFGQGALVLPDTIITNEAYAAYRKFLTRSGKIRKIVHFKNSVFENASVGTALLFWSEEINQKSSLEIIQVKDAHDLIAGNYQKICENIEVITNKPNCNWYVDLKSDYENHQFSKTKSVIFSEIAYLKDGINPGPKYVRERILTKDRDNDGSLKPCLTGKDITPFQIKKPQFWVRYAPERITASEKKAGTSLRQEWIFSSPSIVYRQTAPYLIAAVSLGKPLYTLNSVHNIILKEPNEDILFALCGYLNSSFFREYYQQETGEIRKIFPQVHISSMKNLLIPQFLLEKEAEHFQELVSISKKLSFGSEGYPEWEVRILEVEKRTLFEKLNQIIDSLVK